MASLCQAKWNCNCSSWAQACNLQTALTNAVSGDQIWVAAGTYKPTTSNDRTATFQMKSGIAVYGGFPAAGGDWSSRNWETNKTTLSGSIGIVVNASSNSYHVVKAENVQKATLDGFSSPAEQLIMRKAFTDTQYGGGIYIKSSTDVTLVNVEFDQNVAIYGGGLL